MSILQNHTQYTCNYIHIGCDIDCTIVYNYTHVLYHVPKTFFEVNHYTYADIPLTLFMHYRHHTRFSPYPFFGISDDDIDLLSSI